MIQLQVTTNESRAWLMRNVANGKQACEDRLGMAALLVAAWVAELKHDSAEVHVSMRSAAAALTALPCTLPALLRHRAWRPAAEAVAQCLAALLERTEQTRPPSQVRYHPRISLLFTKIHFKAVNPCT
jgi:hypothetical protein